jgi:ectoine hydroxylase-related dioxygenase (phytanoyl-CoA dioxygenase family)
MVSEPGARRQPVHPDTPCGAAPLAGGEEPPPVVVTGFVALQDVTRAMGPTLLWRGTHTVAAHAAWEEEKVGFLERTPSHVALLSRGDMLLFDSRALHCGGENSAADGQRRRLFYFSFKRANAATGKSGHGTLRAELRGRYSIGSIGDTPPTVS